MNEQYLSWLDEHLEAAKTRYEELCKLDDAEETAGTGDSTYYVQAQQMYGYIAALEKCQREANAAGKDKTASKKTATSPKPSSKKKSAKR